MTPASIAFGIFGIALYSFHRLFKAADRCFDPVLDLLRNAFRPSDDQYPQPMD